MIKFKTIEKLLYFFLTKLIRDRKSERTIYYVYLKECGKENNFQSGASSFSNLHDVLCFNLFIYLLFLLLLLLR